MKRMIQTTEGEVSFDMDGEHPEWKAVIDQAVAEGKPIAVSDGPPEGPPIDGAVWLETSDDI